MFVFFTPACSLLQPRGIKSFSVQSLVVRQWHESKKVKFRMKLCGAQKMQESQMLSKCERHYFEVTLELF